ncbi:MAG: tail fiber protein [Halomonas sp.]|nr:tail fiber protein [Halomonas sp.]
MIKRASQSKAEGKTDNEAAMTALRVAQQNATWGGGVNIREYKLPDFQFGSGGISDEYLLLVPWEDTQPHVVMGEIRSSRGGESAANIPTVEPVIASTGYGQTFWLKRHHDAGMGSRFGSVVRLSVEGSEYLALKADLTGGISLNLLSFMGTVVGGDSRVFSRVRESDPDVSVIEVVGKSYQSLHEGNLSIVQGLIDDSRSTDQFSLYNDERTYYTGEIVRGADGRFYEFYDRDQVGAVQGVDPTDGASRPHIWMEWHGVRPGTVIEWRSGTLPEGYVENDGAAISRSDYRRIFDVYGTDHGEGDGTTTFNLPDDRGEFKRGWDHGRGVDPSRSIYSNQDHAVEYHLHALPTGTGQTLGGAWGVHDGNWQETNTGGSSINSSPAADAYAGTYDRPVAKPTNTNWKTGNWSNETRPRNNAVVYLTKI